MIIKKKVTRDTRKNSDTLTQFVFHTVFYNNTNHNLMNSNVFAFVFLRQDDQHIVYFMSLNSLIIEH